jgi:hypothetical protein
VPNPKIKIHATIQPLVFENYTALEYEETPEGKFGGYKVLPRVIPPDLPKRLYPLGLEPKYDANKGLDLTRSNNGIQR